MSDEIVQLQSEIAAVEALVAGPEAAHTPASPGAGWIPTPSPQPWLEARSA